MKLTFERITRMSTGLSELSGRIRVIESEGKPSNAVHEPFAFPTKTRVNIVRNLQILRPFVEAYQEARKALIASISPDGLGASIDADPKLASQFTKEVYELEHKSPQDVKGLLSIQWPDLDVAKVPALTVEKLGVLVRDLPKADDADLIPEDPAAPAA